VVTNYKINVSLHSIKRVYPTKRTALGTRTVVLICTWIISRIFECFSTQKKTINLMAAGRQFERRTSVFPYHASRQITMNENRIKNTLRERPRNSQQCYFYGQQILEIKFTSYVFVLYNIVTGHAEKLTYIYYATRLLYPITNIVHLFWRGKICTISVKLNLCIKNIWFRL